MKREHRVTIRLTDTEFSIIENAAEQAEMSISEYMRTQTMQGQVNARFEIVGASTLARNKNYYKPQKCGLFYVKFYLFLCCTELYFIFICDIMRYETQL